MSEIIEVKNLKKYYKETKAVDEISFKVQKGELFGFLGINGAGKSTTINMLTTILEPTDGNAMICGYELGRNDSEIRRKIGVVYQQNCLDNNLSVTENLLIRASMYDHNSKKNKNRLNELSEMLNMMDILKMRYGRLSGGQKRRCEIANALMHAPEILFLDEPTTGLDPATRKNVWECINKLTRELKMTVFLTTHYMEEAAKADHISIINMGHIVTSDTPYNLKNKYAKDVLNLYPNDFSKTISILNDKNINYKKKEDSIRIKVDNTLETLPIVNELRCYLKGFEVINGTMDDVFLNITDNDKK